MKKIITSLFAILISTYYFSQIPSYVNQNQLKGWWSFNGSCTNLIDNQFNGTVYGASISTDRNGVDNSSMYFNGINNYIEIGNLLDISNESVISISAWFKPEQSTNPLNQYVGIDFGKKTTGNLSLRIRSNSDRQFQSLLAESSLSGNKIESCISDNNYSYSEWYHLVAIYKNNATYLYVNGELQSNIYSSGALLSQVPSSAILNFGKSFTDLDNENFFLGSIDDIGIWNRELTELEINDLYVSDESLNLKTITKNKTINIYPNPTSDYLSVTINDGEYEGIKLIFVNQLGQIVFNSKISDITTTINSKKIGSNGCYSVLIYDINDTLIDTKSIVIN